MTKKEVSRRHEEFIAKTYGGRRSPSSGASDTDKGDVRIANDNTIFECKATGEPGGPDKRSTVLTQMEKMADEAWAEGKEPALALRLFSPSSPLSNHEGWVDFTVRLTRLDAERGV